MVVGYKIGYDKVIYYLAEAGPLPLSAIPTYLVEKYKRDTYREQCDIRRRQMDELTVKFYQYAADNLWVVAAGMTFIETNEPRKPSKYKTKATYPRWIEFLNPEAGKTPKQANLPRPTKEDIIAHMKRFMKKDGIERGG